MNARLRVMRILVGLSGALLIAAPSQAFAHDNLGGDELAVANWMLVAAMVVLVMGVLAGIWAARTGQFSNVEESKYRMLDTAEDFDRVMADADARVAAAKAAEAQAAAQAAKPDARQPKPERAEGTVRALPH
ncbi:MAG: cbb3-type cytochrome oxidase assembly protein [Chloroflexia bacterium]